MGEEGKKGRGPEQKVREERGSGTSSNASIAGCFAVRRSCMWAYVRNLPQLCFPQVERELTELSPEYCVLCT